MDGMLGEETYAAAAETIEHSAATAFQSIWYAG